MTTTTNEKTALVLRTCAPDRTSYHGSFRWPAAGPVEAPDWDPRPVGGGGLHGLLWGEGDGSLLDRHADAVWLVVEVEVRDLVVLQRGKVKFPRGIVVYAGGRAGALDYLTARAPRGVAIVGATVTVGDHGTAMVGDYGAATAGDGGTATAGDGGHVTAGYRGTATADDGGTATAGDYGTAIVGTGGTATAGYRGTAMVGRGGTATAGICGTAAAGEGGTAAAGEGGTLLLRWWDGVRYRTTTLYVGEDGIEAGQPYRLDARGRPVKVARDRAKEDRP
jgi:hypothetical protein